MPDTMCLVLALLVMPGAMRLVLFVKTKKSLLQTSLASCDAAVVCTWYRVSTSVQHVLSQPV
eukprot:6284782-Prorocentrum_lima.AAC.1